MYEQQKQENESYSFTSPVAKVCRTVDPTQIEQQFSGTAGEAAPQKRRPRLRPEGICPTVRAKEKR